MSKARTYSTKDMEKILKKNGYTHVRNKGSHMIYSNGIFTVPIKHNLNKMIALRIIKECNLKVE